MLWRRCLPSLIYTAPIYIVGVRSNVVFDLSVLNVYVPRMFASLDGSSSAASLVILPNLMSCRILNSFSSLRGSTVFTQGSFMVRYCPLVSDPAR
jgi:hypothetical protein